MTRKIATSSEIREHHRDFIVAPQASPASSGSRLGAIRQDKTSFRRPLVDLKRDRTKRSGPTRQNFKTLYRSAQKGGRLGAPQDDWLPGTRTGPRHAGEHEAKQHGNYDRRGDKSPAARHLRRSGIDVADAKRMRVKLDGDNDRYKIPYFDVSGRLTGFHRWRLLQPEPDGPRYLQPKNTVPDVYFPPIRPWPKIIADPTTSLDIGEGEKKSYRACKDGRNCLGLGRVFSFQSKKNGIVFLSGLDPLQVVLALADATERLAPHPTRERRARVG
jgi:hypothetical protein